MSDLPRLPPEAGDGDPSAGGDLIQRLYEELRDLARRELARERPDHTLQPTALVNEAYLRLVGSGGSGASFESRAHFFGAAATAIRRVLVDHARARASARRGGGARREQLDTEGPAAPQEQRWIELDAALAKLAVLSPRKARIVELRFFAGLEHAELASILGVSEPTVRREWRFARAWLRAELEDAGGP